MSRALCFALLATACASPPLAASAKQARAPHCEYRVSVESAQPARLDVRVRCSGRSIDGFVLGEDSVEQVSELQTADGTRLARHGQRFALPKPATHAEIRYQFDLEALAERAQSFDVALRVGRSLVAPASSYLVRPDPDGGSASVHVELPDGVTFSSGMQRTGPTSYAIEANEIRVATYTVLGQFDKHSLRMPRATGSAPLDVAVLDAPLDVPRPELIGWIDESARAVSSFWGQFPSERALLTVVPRAQDKRVVFGKVLPESRPGIVLVVGQHAQRRDLYDDWILVHELFHLGFPSFDDEGKWLDEGLATYYEPIIRARAGWLSERQLWSDFVSAMPRGLGAIGGDGLDAASTFGGIYWGGAIVCLLADVAVRKRTQGKRGLEHGLRALFAQGAHASEVWELQHVIEVIDQALGEPTLAPLGERYATAGEPLELDTLWGKLGIEEVKNGVRLHDDAPLAEVRRAIVWGGPPHKASGRTSGKSSP